MSKPLKSAIVVVGIDIGKNSFHVVGLDQRGAIVLRRVRGATHSPEAWAKTVHDFLIAFKRISFVRGY